MKNEWDLQILFRRDGACYSFQKDFFVDYSFNDLIAAKRKAREYKVSGLSPEIEHFQIYRRGSLFATSVNNCWRLQWKYVR